MQGVLAEKPLQLKAAIQPLNKFQKSMVTVEFECSWYKTKLFWNRK